MKERPFGLGVPLCFILISIAIIIGAIAHEYDMARNMRKKGDNRSWFWNMQTGERKK